MDGWMPYVTGGLAYGEFQGTGTTPFGTFGTTVWGAWTVGGGVEVPWMDRWTWRVEYLYIDTGHHTDSFVGGTVVTNSRAEMNVARFGVNYRF